MTFSPAYKSDSIDGLRCANPKGEKNVEKGEEEEGNAQGESVRAVEHRRKGHRKLLA